MNEDRPESEQAARLRARAEQLELEAQRTGDAAERQRLTETAVRIREQVDRMDGPESATMDPM
ncbi:DUF6381 family protein [Streptomyces bambusae]|uniref:DUF6381 family protein n=1 Tax=Streptomyces bambusae TaxID=1550616 RepID=UPI001CFCEF9E|nr:DUF6381 family protein [Streptomyces bambusae]MCB5166496.1 DUF6381 family protein [Streptomyces bambusae]